MHLIKPTWLAHGGDVRDFEVYSCHISPDGKRLATAGGDGYIRIWSTEAILRSNDPTYTGPKQLAAVSNHTGTIHAVRFSPNNKYLASGADDKFVCIYSIDSGKPVTNVFGSGESPPVENWRIVKRLIGHDNDVQDLGWSCDSSILVSVGLDSKVVIWSGFTFEKLRVLEHHQSHVKGITFDPANKYFATASDDRTVRIYRFTSPGPNSTAHDQSSNFALEKIVRDPFDGSPLTTYFRRCSWSPDGNHIAAANAVNGPVRSVAIITRGTWQSEIHLIGHEGPVEVCAFSPRLFCAQEPSEAQDSDSGQALTVIACAGQDKSISVWNTSLSRPFAILQDASRKSVSDLAWSPQGEELFVSSLDGSIFAIVFERGELGYVAPVSVCEKSLARFGGGGKARIAECVDAVHLEEVSREAETKEAGERLGALMGATSSALETAPVTTTSSSNNPAPATAAPEAGDQSTSTNTNGTSHKSNPKSTNGAAPPAATDSKQSSNTNGTSTEGTNNNSNSSSSNNQVEELKQRVTYTKDGKKKVRPLLISASGTAAPMPALSASQAVQTATHEKADAGHAILDLSKPYDVLPPGGLAGLIFGNRRKFADGSEKIEKRAAAVLAEGSVPILADSAAGVTAMEPSGPSVVTQLINPSLAVSRLRLGVPTIRTSFQRTVDGSAPDEKSATPTLSMHNTPRSATRVVCLSATRTLWADFLARPVLLATGNSSFWAVGCDDSSIIVWTPSGRRLFAPLILDASVVIMNCCDNFLFAISAVGMVHVWNIRSMRALHAPVSLAPVLDAASQDSTLTTTPSVSFARITSTGTVVVGISSGMTFMYSSHMMTWQRTSEPWWAVTSQYWNTSSTSYGPTATSTDGKIPRGAGVVSFLERHTTTHALVRGRSFFLQKLVKSLLVADSFEGLETVSSIGHLETRLASALVLGAKDEFRSYLLTYVKRLGTERMGARVQEVLDALVYIDGGADPSAEDDLSSEDSSEDEDAPVDADMDVDIDPLTSSRCRCGRRRRRAEAGAQPGTKCKHCRKRTGPSTAGGVGVGGGGITGGGPGGGAGAGMATVVGASVEEREPTGWLQPGPTLCGWRRMDLLADVVKVLGKYRDLQRMVLPYARLVGLVGDGKGGEGGGES